MKSRSKLSSLPRDWNCGEGDDSVTIIDNQAVVSVNGGSGNDRLHLDRSSIQSPLVGTITSAAVNGFGVEPIHYDSTVERFVVSLGSGDDLVTVSSTRADAVTEINGGSGDDRFLTAALEASLVATGQLP